MLMPNQLVLTDIANSFFLEKQTRFRAGPKAISVGPFTERTIPYNDAPGVGPTQHFIGGNQCDED